MKTMKIIALLLAVMLCLPLLAACAESSNNTANTRPPSGDGGAQDVGNFADADYNQQEFTFLFLQQLAGDQDYYGGNYLDAEKLTGEKIEDAVFKRNQAVEEKYNVQVTQRIENVNNSGDPVVILRTFHQAGDHVFDVIYGWGYKLGACIVEGLLADISTLPRVDLTQEYWSPSTVEELSINNKLYLTINDISMNKLEWGGFLFFNKKLVEDYNLETTDIGNFYNRVKDGTWTYDVYLNAIKAVSTDLDGDGVITKTDVYGLIDGSSSGLSLGQSCGITFTQKEADGSYSLSYNTTKSIDLAKKIQEVYANNKYVKTYEELGQNADNPSGMEIHQYYRSFFTQDKSLFCTGTAHITNEFRNMDSEYGIIPMPKYDENQKNYISIIDTNSSIFAIPSTYRQGDSTGSPERTGTILEYMAYKSNQLVLPAYYEEVLKGQRLNTDDDKLMLDTIRTNIHYEFSQMMGITSIAENCTAMFENPNSAGSQYKRFSKSLQKELDDFYAAVLLKNTETAE